jgi:hypothetical protein
MPPTPRGGYVPRPEEAEEYGIEDDSELEKFYEYARTQAQVREAQAAEKKAEADHRAELILEGFVLFAFIIFVYEHVDVNVRIP